MDRETMSTYGFIVITTILLALLLGIATPIGERVTVNIENSVETLFNNTGVSMDNNDENYGTIIIHHRLKGSATDLFTYKARARIGEKVFFDTYAEEGYVATYNNSKDNVPTYITASNGEQTIYIYYIKDTYTVTYNLNGGTFAVGETHIQEYEYGGHYVLPTAVEKPNYKFVGWFEDSGLSGYPILSISSSDVGNKTYYAKYAIN